MTYRSKRLKEALDECAELGVPDVADPWPALKQRAVKRLDERFSERARVHAVARRSARRSRLLPRTRPGRVFATTIVLLALGTGAYATGGIMDVLDGIFGEVAPYVQRHELGAPVEKKMARDGATVTLDRVYADQRYVVLGLHVDGLDGLGDRPGNARDDLLANVGLSDPAAENAAADGGGKFWITDEIWQFWGPPGQEGASPYLPSPPKGSQVGTVVFQSRAGMAPGEHRFRVEVQLSRFRGDSEEPVVPPFVFELEVPVAPAPTIEVNQTVERGGVPITLTRVVNSPVGTYAFLCFDPPEDGYDWPAVRTGPLGLGGGHLAEVPVYHEGASAAAEDGCATYNFGETLYDKPGTHSLTVTELHASDPDVRGSVKGPWGFRFKVPDPRGS